MEINVFKFRNLIAFTDKRILRVKKRIVSIHKIWSDCIINYTIVCNVCFVGIVCCELGYCKKQTKIDVEMRVRSKSTKLDVTSPQFRA